MTQPTVQSTFGVYPCCNAPAYRFLPIRYVQVSLDAIAILTLCDSHHFLKMGLSSLLLLFIIANIDQLAVSY